MSTARAFGTLKATEPTEFTSLCRRYDQGFTFHFNDFSTFAASDALFQDVERFLSDPQNIEEALDTEETLFAELAYKAASYNLHLKRNSARAAELLALCTRINFKLFFTPWVLNHRAFAEHQLLVAAKAKGETDVVKKRFFTVNKLVRSVIEEDPNDVEACAFALCVKALSLYETGQLDNAIGTYGRAIELYETNNYHYDQWARAKCRLAQMHAEAGHFEKAGQMFAQLQEHWVSTDLFNQNPYQCRFDDAYSKFLASIPKPATEPAQTQGLRA